MKMKSEAFDSSTFGSGNVECLVDALSTSDFGSRGLEVELFATLRS